MVQFFLVLFPKKRNANFAYYNRYEIQFKKRKPELERIASGLKRKYQ